MTDDQAAKAEPATSWSTAWRWTAARWPVDRRCLGRLLKYVFLVVVLLLTLKVVFDCYSYYVARRGIDAELESKKIASLEYLILLQRRERVLMIDTLETRCAERAELAFFRVFSVQKENRIRDYYKHTMDIKNALVDEINRLGPGFVDVKAAVDYVNRATFSVAGFRDSFKILPNIDKDDQKFKDLMEQVEGDLGKYDALVLGDPGLQDLIREAQQETRNRWHVEAVRALEERLARLKEERKAAKSLITNGNLEEVLARYRVWTDALTGGASDRQLLDEFADQVEQDDTAALGDVDCQRFNALDDAGKPTGMQPVGAVDVIRVDAPKSWIARPIAEKVALVRLWYSGKLLNFFNQPPAAQTLFVTLFMGTLGGLTVNVLRLSQLGWWRGQRDPLWGEIFVSPVLGALAAFAVYLIGSAGLLLTSDFRAAQSGVSALSASFIGLLGFLSGFLYDAAFGRVRRAGTELFADPASADPMEAAPEDDRSLAQTLRGANASLAAGLLLGYGVGGRLASENAFTLLVPSDRAVGRMTLETWTALNDRKGDAFDRWYRHHHAAERLAKKDLTGANVAARQLALEDGTSVDIRLAGDDLAIGTTKTIIADIGWRKGVIHILQDDLG